MPCLACLLLAGIVATQTSNPISIDTPRAGWREAHGEGARYTQGVNYPANSVATPEGQADSARILGRIHGAPKGPAHLVVNGVAMPLQLDENGGFDRPYAFAPGSNAVEVRHPDGSAASRVQFFQRNVGQVPAKLRVLLAWDSDNTDLDLHVVTPDGSHAWYGERSLANGGALDVDVTTGYGPEIFASPTPQRGQYLVFVNYYGGGYDEWSDSDEPAQALTTAQITIVGEEGTINEKRQTFLVPMRKPGELTLVARFSYP